MNENEVIPFDTHGAIPTDKSEGIIFPEGWYELAVLNYKKVYSAKGNKTIQLTFRVLSGDYEGQKVYDILVLTSHWRGWIRNFLESLELEGEVTVLRPNQWINRTCMAYIIPKKRNDINTVKNTIVKYRSIKRYLDENQEIITNETNTEKEKKGTKEKEEDIPF